MTEKGPADRVSILKGLLPPFVNAIYNGHPGVDASLWRGFLSMDPDVACRTSERDAHNDNGGRVHFKGLSVTRQLFPILLASLRLQVYRYTCRADAGLWEVDGSELREQAEAVEHWLMAWVSACGERSRSLRGSCFLFMGILIQKAQDRVVKASISVAAGPPRAPAVRPAPA